MQGQQLFTLKRESRACSPPPASVRSNSHLCQTSRSALKGRRIRECCYRSEKIQRRALQTKVVVSIKINSYSQLPTHATRTRGRANIRSDRNGLELTMTLRNSPSQSHALRARADGIRSVLNVGARNERAVCGGECHSADTEVAIGTVGGSLGCKGVTFEVVELLDGESKGCGGCFEVLHVEA